MKKMGYGQRIGLSIKKTGIYGIRGTIASDGQLKISAKYNVPIDSVLYGDLRQLRKKIREVCEHLTVGPQDAIELLLPDESFKVSHLTLESKTQMELYDTALWSFNQHNRKEPGRFAFDYELHEKSTEQEKKQLVIDGIALNQQLLGEWLTLFEKDGLQVGGLRPPYVAWTEAFRKRCLNDEVKALVYFGEQGCMVRIFKGTVEQMSRRIRFGAGQIYDLLIRYYGLVDDTVLEEHLNKLTLSGQSGGLDEEARKLLEGVRNRLTQTMEVFRKKSGESVKEVWYCGTLADYDFFNAFMKEPWGADFSIERLDGTVLGNHERCEDISDAGAAIYSGPNAANLVLNHADKLWIKDKHRWLSVYRVILGAVIISLLVVSGLLVKKGSDLRANHTVLINQIDNSKEVLSMDSNLTDAVTASFLKSFEQRLMTMQPAVMVDDIFKLNNPEILFRTIEFGRTPNRNFKFTMNGLVNSELAQQEWHLLKLVDQLKVAGFRMGPVIKRDQVWYDGRSVLSFELQMTRENRAAPEVK